MPFRRKFKIKFQNLIGLQVEQKRLEFIEKYLVDSRIIISNSFEDYVNEKISTNRIIFSIIINILYWIAAIRFFLIAVIDKPWIWIKLGDVFYLTGQPCLLNCVLFTAMFPWAILGKI
jgi:hypothetical protein